VGARSEHSVRRTTAAPVAAADCFKVGEDFVLTWLRQAISLATVIIISFLFAAAPRLSPVAPGVDCCFVSDALAEMPATRRYFFRQIQLFACPNIPLRAAFRTRERLVFTSYFNNGFELLQKFACVFMLTKCL
jgi:hypothetical protein